MDFFEIQIKVRQYDRVMLDLERLEDDFEKIPWWGHIRTWKNLRQRRKLLDKMHELSEKLSHEGLLCYGDKDRRYLYTRGFKIWGNMIETVPTYDRR